MLPNKRSYFQGSGKANKPNPKKYKSDPTAPVQSRLDKPLFNNYDLYETPKSDPSSKLGPGAGHITMEQYKSIKDFIKSKRKKRKGKFLNPEVEKRMQNIETRTQLLSKITKKAFDFSYDTINSLPIEIIRDSYPKAVIMDGILDNYLPLNDFEGKSPDKLNFGRDYDSESNDYLDLLINQNFNAKEPEFLGMPDGITPEEDLDASFTKYEINPEYGTTDCGNTIYSNMWY